MLEGALADLTDSNVLLLPDQVGWIVPVPALQLSEPIMYSTGHAQHLHRHLYTHDSMQQATQTLQLLRLECRPAYALLRQIA